MGRSRVNTSGIQRAVRRQQQQTQDHISRGGAVDPIRRQAETIAYQSGVDADKLYEGMSRHGLRSGGQIGALVETLKRPEDIEFQMAGSPGDPGDRLSQLPGYNLESQTNTGFLDQMRTDALRQPGQQSAWRQMMGGKLTSDAAKAQAQSQAKSNQAMNRMAMKGGLTSGARERMGAQAAQQGQQASQEVMRNKYGLDVQDESNRMQGLQGLGQAEMGVGGQKTAADQFNISNRLRELTQKRAFEGAKYSEGMKEWAAKNTANATPSSSGGKK